MSSVRRKDFRSPIKSQLKDLVGRLLWKVKSFDKDILCTLVITDKCTLHCEHCFE